MDISNTELNMNVSLYAFDKAKDVKSQEILSAIGMTPETQKAQEKIDAQNISQAIGKGVNFDTKA